MSDEVPDPEVPERANDPRSYSARYKAEILAEYETWTVRARRDAAGARKRPARADTKGGTPVTRPRRSAVPGAG